MSAKDDSSDEEEVVDSKFKYDTLRPRKSPQGGLQFEASPPGTPTPVAASSPAEPAPAASPRTLRPSDKQLRISTSPTPSREDHLGGDPRFVEADTSDDDTELSPRARRLRETKGSAVRSVDFSASDVILTERRPLPSPDARPPSALSKKTTPGMADKIEDAEIKVSGVKAAVHAALRASLRVGEELLQFHKNGGGPRRRKVRITEDGCDIKYVDANISDFKKKSTIGKMLSSALRKQRPLAEVHCLVYGRCPVMIRGDHPAALTFSIRFHTEKWNVLKTVHFGCADDAQLVRWFMGLQSLIPMSKWHLSLSRLYWQRIKLKLRQMAIQNRVQPADLLADLVQEARKMQYESYLKKQKEVADRREEKERKRAQQEEAKRRPHQASPATPQ